MVLPRTSRASRASREGRRTASADQGPAVPISVIRTRGSCRLVFQNDGAARRFPERVLPLLAAPLPASGAACRPGRLSAAAGSAAIERGIRCRRSLEMDRHGRGRARRGGRGAGLVRCPRHGDRRRARRTVYAKGFGVHRVDAAIVPQLAFVSTPRCDMGAQAANSSAGRAVRAVPRRRSIRARTFPRCGGDSRAGPLSGTARRLGAEVRGPPLGTPRNRSVSVRERRSLRECGCYSPAHY